MPGKSPERMPVRREVGLAVYEDDRLGPVRLRRSPRARRLSLRVHPERGVTLTIPMWCSLRDALAFLEGKRDWALRWMEKGRSRHANPKCSAIPDWVPDAVRLMRRPEEWSWLLDKTDISELTEEQRVSFVELMRWQAKRTLPCRLRELAARYGLADRLGKVTIKHNSSNWGSCSKAGNINLNLNLVRVPAHCRDYLLLHELCHLVYMNHGTAFHEMLDGLCRDNLSSLGLADAYDAASCRRELGGYVLL